MYVSLCMFTRVHVGAHVGALPMDGAVDRVSGRNLTPQLDAHWVGESAKHSLAPFLSHNSQRTPWSSGSQARPEFSRFCPGRSGCLAPCGSSVTAWEMKGAAGARMSSSLGSRSAMAELGLGGASAEFSGACPPTTPSGTAFLLLCRWSP